MFTVQHDVLDNFLNLINIPSESGDEREIIDYIVKRLKLYTRNVKICNERNTFGKGCGNVIAKIKGNPKCKTIMFCVHLDTVKPGKNINPQILNNTITTDGTTILGADDKAGIAAILTLLKLLHKDKFNACPIELVFTVSEESGLVGAKNMDFSQLQSKFGYVLDSDGDVGKACIKAPSYLYIKAIVKGKAAHAGMNPQKGINSIKIAAEAISKIPSGAVDSETCMNVGKINGGLVTNIVPELTEVEFEIRSYSDAKLKKYQSIIETNFKNAAKKFKGEVKFITDLQFQKYDFNKSNESLRVFMDACKSLKLPVRLENSFGGSDANIFNANGIEALNISAGFTNPHSVNETIKLSALKELVDLIYEIVKNCSK